MGGQALGLYRLNVYRVITKVHVLCLSSSNAHTECFTVKMINIGSCMVGWCAFQALSHGKASSSWQSGQQRRRWRWSGYALLLL